MKYRVWQLVLFIAIVVGITYILLTIFSDGIDKMDCSFKTHKFLMPNGCSSEFSENPVLQLKCPPAFTKITHANLKSGLKCGLEFYKINFKNFEEEIEKRKRLITWENVIDYIEIIKAPYEFSAGILDLLLSVNYSNLLQSVETELNPLIAEVNDLQGKSTNFYFSLQNLKNQKGLSHFKKAYLQRTLHMFSDPIDPKHQKEFEVLSQQKYEDQLKYKSNIMSSKEELAFLIYKRSEVLGIPSDTLKQMSTNAQKMRNLSSSPENGPWLFTMESIIRDAVLKYSNSKSLRDKVWKRYTQIGCTKNYNNSEVIDRLRGVMERLAQINGYESYIQSVLSNSIVQKSATVLDFLEELYNKTKDKVNEKMTHLKSYGSLLGINNISKSDIYYINHKFSNHSNDLKDIEIRRHFPKEYVIKKIFSVMKDLFDIEIKESKDNDDLYAPNVTLHNAYDGDGEYLGSIILDIHSRGHGKSSGAWTSKIRRAVQSLNVKPIVIIVANFDMQDTVTIPYITTFLHELGHALSLILSSNYAVESYMDTAEVPSKFLEHFTYNHEILKRISFPEVSEELLNDIHKQQSSASGIDLQTQIYYSLLDQKIFLQINDSWSTVTANVLNMYNPVSYFLTACNFYHFFIYDYGARYYSYFFSEAIALQILHNLFQEDHFRKERAMKIRRLLFEKKDMTSEAEIILLLLENTTDDSYLLQHYGL